METKEVIKGHIESVEVFAKELLSKVSQNTEDYHRLNLLREHTRLIQEIIDKLEAGE